MLKAIQGVLAAFLGVQSRRAFQEDMATNRPWRYLFIGLLFTGLFVLSIAFTVHLALR